MQKKRRFVTRRPMTYLLAGISLVSCSIQETDDSSKTSAPQSWSQTILSTLGLDNSDSNQSSQRASFAPGGSGDVKAAYTYFKNEVEYFRPKVVALPTAPSFTCDARNPGHSPLGTGKVIIPLTSFLSFNSSIADIDFGHGYGPGVVRSDLTVAYIIASPGAGRRAVVKVGGEFAYIVPLSDYSGSFPYWPKKMPKKASLVGEVLEISSDQNQVERFEKAGENVYFLTASFSPYRAFQTEYGTSGILRRFSSNSCDSETKFSYDKGRLVKAEIRSGTQHFENNYIYSDNAIRGYTSADLSSPIIGEIKNFSARAIKWNDFSKIASISDEKGTYLSAWTYDKRNGRVLQNLLPGEVRTFLAGDSESSFLSTKNANGVRVTFDSCRERQYYRKPAYQAPKWQASENDYSYYNYDNGLEEDFVLGTAKQYTLRPTDIEFLELEAVSLLATSSSKTMIDVDRDTFLVRKTSVMDASQNQVITIRNYSYDADGRVLKITGSDGGSMEGPGETKILSQYTYSNGFLKTYSTPRLSRQMLYNADGKLSEMNGPGVSQSYSYNSQGSLTKKIDLLDKITNNYSYDQLCRLQKESNPLQSKTYAYADDGRISNVSQKGLFAESTEYFHEDEMGYTVEKKIKGGRSVETKYDYWGNVLMTAVNGELDYAYQEKDSTKVMP